MKYILILFTILLLGIGSILHASSSTKPVSLISLIAIPEEFTRQKIVVKGYFSFDKLFLNQVSADISDSLSAVFILDPTKDGELSKSCDKKYVTVFGTFVQYKGRYEIIDVTRVIDINGLEDCWESTSK